MKVFRVKRSEQRSGEWEDWLINNVFSTHEKANQYITDHPITYVRQEVIEQKVE